MDPPRTRSRSRSGFYHFNGNVGGNAGGNSVGTGSSMNASGGGLSYPPQQHSNNAGWATHHGGRSYPENQQQQQLQQQHSQGSYLSAGGQRHASHGGAHRHPVAGKQDSAFRKAFSQGCFEFFLGTCTRTHTHPEGCKKTTGCLTGF